MPLMAPRRNNNSGSSIVHQQQQQQQPPQQQQQQLQQSTPPPQQQHQQQQQALLLTAALYQDDNNFFDHISNSSNGDDTLNNISNISLNIDSSMSPMQTSNSGGGSNNNNSTANHGHSNINEQYTRCCYPNGDCFKLDSIIALDDLSDCVRIICNNENCNVGQYMHRECFESWEQTVLVFLKSIGRARSWSDRQRLQNLWTKKGYDLVYKVCGCKCGRGHIRKDLEWSSPNGKSVMNGHFINGSGGGGTSAGTGQQRIVNGNGGGIGGGGGGSACSEEDEKKKKKKRNRNNQKPTLALAPLNPNGYHPNSQQQQQQQQNGHVSTAGQNVNIVNGIGTNCAHTIGLVNGNGGGNNSNSVNGSNSNNGNNITPNPNVGVIGSGLHHNQQQQQQQQSVVAQLTNNIINSNGGNILGLDLRNRAGSLSSSGGSGSTSPSASQSSVDMSISPIHHQQQQQQQQHQQMQIQHFAHSLIPNGYTKSIINCVTNAAVAASLLAKQPQPLLQPQPPQPSAVHPQTPLSGLKQLISFDQQQMVQQQKNKEVELYSERVRSTSGCNGIFSRRLDFSSFNLLPKTRLNSYQVKIEDEGNHGNDETRLFILSSLAQSQMSRVACILCEEPMLVFDRYPLVDGSFFLSPKQHSPGCIEVKYEGRSLYLTCVCMTCLDGTSTNRVISCRFCGELWDGSNLVLGTMYAYDIFAAMPCCAERFKCNHCFKLLLHPQQRLNFYSDYSHCVTCPFCATQDTHFVKPLSYCYAKSTLTRQQQLA